MTQRLRRHGDIVERLVGGFYRAHGRADDTMNLGGIKVKLHQYFLTPGRRLLDFALTCAYASDECCGN